MLYTLPSQNHDEVDITISLYCSREETKNGRKKKAKKGDRKEGRKKEQKEGRKAGRPALRNNLNCYYSYKALQVLRLPTHFLLIFLQANSYLHLCTEVVLTNVINGTHMINLQQLGSLGSSS